MQPLSLFGIFEKLRKVKDIVLQSRWGALDTWLHTEEKRWEVETLSTKGRTRGVMWGKLRIEKETKGTEKKITQQKVEQMNARKPCCVGFICVSVYLVGGVAVAAAVTAVGHRPLLWQRLRHFQCRCLDGDAVQRFCWSEKRHVNESVGCVRGCGFGSGPQTGKASMCQGYCEISR